MVHSPLPNISTRVLVDDPLCGPTLGRVPRTPGGLSAHEALILVPDARVLWHAEYERCERVGLRHDASVWMADAHVVSRVGAEADRLHAAAIAEMGAR